MLIYKNGDIIAFSLIVQNQGKNVLGQEQHKNIYVKYNTGHQPKDGSRADLIRLTTDKHIGKKDKLKRDEFTKYLLLLGFYSVVHSNIMCWSMNHNTEVYQLPGLSFSSLRLGGIS